MKDIFFWVNWDQWHGRTYSYIMCFTALIYGVMLSLVMIGPDAIYEWYVKSSLNTIPIAFEAGPAYLQDLAIDLNVQVIKQNFIGSTLILKPVSSYLFLILFSMGLIGCLTIISFLSRYWFIISIGLFTLLLGSVGFERVGLFGLDGMKPTIIVFFLYVPILYYFQSVNPNVHIGIRFMVLLAITAILGLVVGYFANVEQSILHLANYCYLPSVIFTIVLIFLVGHEIVYAILSIATQESKSLSNKNTIHFLILSVIYLINVLLIYLKNASHIDWDILYINPFVLLTCSVILGIWGLKSREILYKGILPFRPYTAYLYLGLALIAGSTISFHFIQGSDAVLEAFEDMIVFSHIGFGLMFLLYIIVNFISLLLKNLPVYKIAYKEDNFPYFTARLAGLIVVAGLYLLSNQVALSQAIAGYYNGIGDLFFQKNQNSIAKSFYQEGAIYAYNNHKSNYMLGHLTEKDVKKTKHFESATKKNPTEYAFVNLGVQFQESNRFFDAIFNYQEGLNTFPNSHAIRNNLALLYAVTDVNDSTLYYLQSHDKSDPKAAIKLANLFGVLAMKSLESDHLSDINDLKLLQRFDVLSNMLAANISDGTWEFDKDILIPDKTVLNPHTYAYMNNLGIWAIGKSEVFYKTIDTFLRENSNSEYSEYLQFLKAINFYSIGEVNLAFETMESIRNLNGEQQGIYNYLLGLWCLEQFAQQSAIDYFNLAYYSGYANAGGLLMLLPKYANSGEKISLAMVDVDSSLRSKVELLTSIQSFRIDKVSKLSDTQKAHWLEFNIKNYDIIDLIAIAQTIQDLELRSRALTCIVKSASGPEDIAQTKELITSWNLDGSSNQQNSSLNVLHTSPELANQIFTQYPNLPMQSPHSSLSQYWKLINRNNVIADEVLDFVNKNAFYEEIVLESVKFLSNHGVDDQVLYDVLLRAININRYSSKLIKAYIDVSLRMGLSNYAESALLRLLDILDQEAYNVYELKYEEMKDKYNLELNNW